MTPHARTLQPSDFVDDNGVSNFVDDLGVVLWIDDNGLFLGDRDGEIEPPIEPPVYPIEQQPGPLVFGRRLVVIPGRW